MYVMKKRKEKIVCRIIINYSVNYYLSSFKNNIFFFCRIGYELIGDSLKEISIGRRKFFSRL